MFMHGEFYVGTEPQPREASFVPPSAEFLEDSETFKDYWIKIGSENYSNDEMEFIPKTQDFGFTQSQFNLLSSPPPPLVRKFQAIILHWTLMLLSLIHCLLVLRPLITTT
ncbi:uncharacterized protein DS421_8g244610 [Arachis hypogaea]|nr:uncharacterized protein DS421_8g244610 [Arachis hypogaea]